MATVRLDSMLREFLPKRELDTSAPTVGALLDEIEEKFPRMRFRVRDETGKIRRFVKVFVDGEDVLGLNGLDTPIAPGASVDILHSIQGG